MSSWPPWAIGLTIVAIIVCIFGIPIAAGLYGYRGYVNAAERRLDVFVSRLMGINGPISKDYVDLCACYGFLAWATQHSIRVYLTRDNVDEVEQIAADIRSFSFRWGLLAYGAGFIPLMTWWNYKSAFKTIALYRQTG